MKKDIGDLKILNESELNLLMQLSSDKRNDCIIAGYANFFDKHLTCMRGDGAFIMIPFDCFKVSGTGLKPDFEQLEFIDYGQTIKLGEYEAAVTAILYELDESYKNRIDNDLNTWEGQNAARNRKKISN